MKDAEVAELRAAAAAAAKSRGAAVDVDLETIPDSVSLNSFRRKSSNASTLPAELRAVSKWALLSKCLLVFLYFWSVLNTCLFGSRPVNV